MASLRKVLIIARYYHEEYMGAIRMRRLARALPEAGYLPTVLTRGSADAPNRARVLGVDAPDLARMYAKLTGRGGKSGPPDLGASRKIGLTSFINRWAMIPDKDVTWLRPVLRAARNLLAAEPFDLIFASLDPRTNLLAAADLAREFRIPAVMEYRDLWTGSPYFHLDQPTRLHRALHARLERRVLRTAARITCLSRGIAETLKQRYPAETRGGVDVNYNFFDPSEYPAPARPPARRPFVISYVGAMYLSRNPHVFMDGLKLFIEKLRLAPDQFRFRWLGHVVGVDGVAEHLERARLRTYVDYLGQVPHDTALRELMASDATLLIQAPQDTIHIPGKIFEAMGARVPILAITPPCEVSEIIARAGAGVCCPHDPVAVCAALEEIRARRAQSDAWPFNDTVVQTFRMDRAADGMARLFDSAIGRTAA